MEKDINIENFKNTLTYLPTHIAELLTHLPDKTVQAVSEIRLRAGRPLSLTLKGENVFVSEKGHICFLYQHGLYSVTQNDIDLTFRKMCDYSVYAFSEEIRNGFITLKNGCRAGIAATAVYENGKLSTFKAVSSINIRIAGEYIGCARQLINYLSGGLLIAGPPASGKTTLLRDCVRTLSYGDGVTAKRVAVIDSRGEIAATKGGIPQNDLGPFCDVLTGCSKAEGIEIALRTLNPEVIAFDEISGKDEADSVLNGFFAGADVITTVHAGSLDEVMNRIAAKSLITSGAVKHVAFVKEVGAPLQVESYDTLRFEEAVTL